MKNYNRVAVILSLVVFLAWIGIVHYKYSRFGYDDWDLALFSQACWQLLHGTQFVPLIGINYFGDHSYFITFLTLPFFAALQGPLTLVSLKIAAFAASAYLFYRIASEKLGAVPGLVLMALYVFFPPNIFSLLYEYNPESFAPPVLFWMFIAFEKQNWKSFFAAAVLLMTVKENMALIVGMFGIYALIDRKYPFKVAWGAILAGACAFFILTIYVIPHFRHLPQHAFVVRYRLFGNSVGEILYHFVTRPGMVLSMLLKETNIHYIQELFGVLLIPSLIGWPWLILASPLLLQHLLSNHLPEHTIYYFYAASLSPFIFMAATRALTLFRKGKVLAVLLALLAVFSVFQFSIYAQMFADRIDGHRDGLQAVRQSFVSAIPDGEGVIATFDYLAPLSLRRDLYSFHKIYDAYYQDSQKIKESELNTALSFVLPENVHYALIDFRDPWFQYTYRQNPKKTRWVVKTFLQKYHWKTIKRYGDIYLYKRSA